MENWELVSKRVLALDALYKRMDNTKDLVYLSPYTLTKFDNKTPIDNAISVTSNRPAVFANAIISDLMGAKWQTAIEGKVTKTQVKTIERFVNDNLAQADEFLLRRFGISSLNAWLCNHVCIRSLIGARWISQVIDDKYIVDCLPVDMRLTPFDFGMNGYKWVAPITFRSAASLIDEFPELEDQLKGATNEIEVRDFWDDKQNEVSRGTGIEGKGAIIKTQPNSLGKPPFVIVLPSSGFMLRDKGYLEHEAEDLFTFNRNLYREDNRSLSLKQTLGMDYLYPPIMWPVDTVDTMPAPTSPVSGQGKKVKKGYEPVLFPRGDLNKASMVADQAISRLIQEGGISDTELGDVSVDRTAVWIEKQWEIRNKMMRTRIEALQVFREQLARLMIEQFIKINKSGQKDLLIGRTGRKAQYSVKDLGDPDTYTISCKALPQSKEHDIVNEARAYAAWGKIPRSAIFKEILSVEDPDGWERALELEEAKRADPALSLFEMGIRYAEEAEEMEDEADKDLKNFQSMMLIERGVAMVKQRMLPAPPVLPEKAQSPQLEETKGSAQALASMPKLLSQGGGKRPTAQEGV